METGRGGERRVSSPGRWLAGTFCLLVLAAGIPGPASGAPDAGEIMRLVSERPRGNNVVSQVEMILVEENGRRRSRKLRIYSREDADKKQRVLLFLEPADIADTAFLSVNYREEDHRDNQWIHLPALRKTKRIAAGSGGNSFMGSDFSYADLLSGGQQDYSYVFLKDSEVAGAPVWVVEATPKNREVARECGYTKAVFLVRQDIHAVVRSVLWVNGSAALKYIDVRRLEEREGVWVPMEVLAKTTENGRVVHQTVLLVESISFNNKFDDDLFSVQRLEHGYPVP